MSFFLTLPCTASKSEFPNNTIGKYTTLLAHSIELNENYEIGLCEVIIPVPKLSVQEDTEIHVGHTLETLSGIHVLKNNFHSLADVEDFSSPYVRFTYQLDKVSVHIADGYLVVFRDTWFAKLLGVPSVMRGHGESGTNFSGSPRALTELAYIYVDLCANTYIGDSMVPCLRAVPMEPHKPTVIRYENVHYVGLQNIRFSTVSVDISDDEGKTLDFKEGLSLVKIHFRIRK